MRDHLQDLVNSLWAGLFLTEFFQQEFIMNVTKHEMAGQQQHVIPPLIIDWLRQFGFRITGMNGTTVIYFDRESRRMLRSEVGRIAVRRLSDMMDAYLVMSDERIIAVGHRFKRL